jgi:cell division protein FtsB
MFKQYKNQRVIAELEEEIETMKRDSAEIIKRQMQLDFRGNVEAVENLAREKYGMQKDNEDVFVVED